MVEQNGWKYKGLEVTSVDDMPYETIGFIYMITQISTGKKYIGKKLIDKAATKTVKGVKKKIRKPSDWKEYWSSSPDLKALISQVGQQDFVREILVFAKSKGSIAYLEEMALYQCGALESDNWFNNNIRSKVYRSWISKDLLSAKELREKLNSV
jgi:hypothetical protein